MSTDWSPADVAGRPRILATGADFDRAAGLVETGDRAAAWFRAVTSDAEALLDEPPNECEIPDGRRLLGRSRSVLWRVLNLGTAHRLPRKDAYADRLWLELESAAAFPDWNPGHFLGTADMTAAFAVGYDWLREHWSDREVTRLTDAMVEHAVREALLGYRDERSGDELAWMEGDNNWKPSATAD